MLLFLYSATIFAGSFLLFLIQPMITKVILPYLGGSAMVWNTAMLFFQTVLLFGYGYAHLTARFLRPRRQATLHLIVVAASLLLMPIGLVPFSQGDPSTTPLFWLIGTLFLSVGLPYFLLSANATLSQHWFAHTGHSKAKNPYALYVTSNIASFIGLLSFPFIVEPRLDFESQAKVWSVVYGIFFCLLASCILGLKRAYALENSATETNKARPVLAWREKAMWVLLAFAPSSLLQGTTTHILTDIASFPLLWVLPLALYLLTFTIAFSRFSDRATRLCWRIQPVSIILAFLTLVFYASPNLALVLHLIIFFVLALACHGLLARKKPDPAHLTQYYLWISLGGALGGLFNAILAPLIFTGILEYPLTLALICLLIPTEPKSWRAQIVESYPTAIFALFIGLLILVKTINGIHELSWDDITTKEGIWAVIVQGGVTGFFAVMVLSSEKKPLCMALSCLILYVMMPSLTSEGDTRLVYSERNFFGVLKVRDNKSLNAYTLIHGTTLHGIQSKDETHRLTLQAYYFPMHYVYDALSETTRKMPFAVVGLGTGILSCVGSEQQHVDLYEIDPAVIEIANDTRYFTYLRDCPPEKNIILGDARIKLEGAADSRYGMMVIDAYNSDSLPMHLMTREALRLYLSKLAPHGILAFHISSRNLDLGPILARLAADAHLPALELAYEPPRDNKLITPSRWVVMAKDEADLQSLRTNDPAWKPLTMPKNGSVWTDHYSNLLEAIK
ncbi:MAG: fused MFS/spermidine synthase [Rickettsiales bacterium]